MSPICALASGVVRPEGSPLAAQLVQDCRRRSPAFFAHFQEVDGASSGPDVPLW
jgi:hypothetical protein